MKIIKITYNQNIYQHHGWTLDIHVDKEFDNMKNFYTAVNGDNRVAFRWSPYNEPSQQDFELWVDLNTPNEPADILGQKPGVVMNNWDSELLQEAKNIFNENL